MATATIRGLCTKFPKVRRLVETNGAVIVTEHGKPRFLLRQYHAHPSKRPPVVDFYKRHYHSDAKTLAEAQSRYSTN
jgi:hypothetical protein